MSAAGQLTGEEIHEANASGNAEPEQWAPAYSPNPCYNCKEIGHFKRVCPLLNQPVPIIVGKLHHTHDLIHSVSETIHHPVSLTKNVIVPPRIVASVVTLTDLPEPETKIMYKMFTADDPPDPGGNVITYPLCYATMVGGKQKCIKIVVNLGQEKLTLKRGTILGYFERWADETTTGPDIAEGEWLSACTEPETEPEEEPFKGAEMGFLKSPADVDP